MRSHAKGKAHPLLTTTRGEPTVAGLASNAYRKSLWQLNIAVVMWAITALFAKWIALPALQITALRSIIAAATLFVVLRAQGATLRLRSARDFWILAAGGIAMGIHWITYFQSIQMSTVALGILALHTYPVMTALAEPLVFREKMRVLDLLLALLVLIGVAVLVPEYSLASQTTRGILLGVFSAACFAGRNLLSRNAVVTYGGARVTFYQLLGSGLMLLPVSLTSLPTLTPHLAGQVLMLGIVFTALPHALYTSSLAHLKASSAGIIATLLPVYGAITAALLLGEIPSPRTVIGGALIVAAVVCETFRVMRRAQAPKQ